MDDSDVIADVLDGFVPVGVDHPKAQETLAAVRAHVVARAGDERAARLDRICNEIDRLRAEIDELRRNPDV